MFAHIRGIFTYSSPLYVVVETGGVGYKLFVPASLHGHLPQIGQQLLLHTSFIVREQSQALYGFISQEDRDVFEVLLGISGVGPKTALSLIGHLSTHHLYEAISNCDIPKICKVPGIGKKSAERLIVEMRDKLPSLFAEKSSTVAGVARGGQRGQVVNDAMSALINLGYNQSTSEKALKRTLQELPDAVDLAELITLALKNV